MTTTPNEKKPEPWERTQRISSTSTHNGWSSFAICEKRGEEIQRLITFKSPDQTLKDGSGPFLDISIEEFVGISRRSKLGTARVDEAPLRKLYELLHAKFGEVSQC